MDYLIKMLLLYCSDKPRIHSSTVDFQKLKQLPEGTLGYTYFNFLERNVSSKNFQTNK